ncbi:MAG: hypothetical protein JXB45_05280 [Candidatus Krumholzibacteriota bacterium]|nr:hypothetical protein [Candidatus Krumholzibacteriota bacterium]
MIKKLGVHLILILLLSAASPAVEAPRYQEIIQGKIPLPRGWKLEKRVEVSPFQRDAIARKLGGNAQAISNSVFSFEGKTVQINLVECETASGAEAVYRNILAMHGNNPRYVMIDGTTVIEFTRTALAERQARDKEVGRRNCRGRGRCGGENGGDSRLVGAREEPSVWR